MAHPSRRPRPAPTGTVRTAEAQASALRQTRRKHSSETAEDYVEAIAELTESVGEARAVELARRLGVSHVTVIRTVSRLQRDGYLSTRPYRAIFLTDKGVKLARESRERHHLVVEFLRSLGIPEPAVQADAEGIEHHVSAETLAAFRRHLKRAG
ncbi:MAG: manganese-binding transcriptional regulator MntR [Acidobacteria bacterium]|nr:MAG: manganese-binding transcriptional regulator MntR [Acidobacteriota bacterium]